MSEITPIPETTVTAPAVAPVVEAVQTPIAAPVVAAVETTTPTPTPVATPVVEPVKAPETVLAVEIDKTTPKVEEVKPPEATVPVVEGDKKNDETGQSEEPAPPPVYDTFTVPEGITLDGDRVSKFTEILGDLEKNAKGIDHALVQQFGQKAVDFHVAELQKQSEEFNKYITTSWERTKQEWKDSFLKDPEIGGNRFQTTVDNALNFIRTHGGTPEQQTEFRNLMETSGLGNHPTMIRLLANAGLRMSEGKPLAAVQPVPQTKSKLTTMYGSQK